MAGAREPMYRTMPTLEARRAREKKHERKYANMMRDADHNAKKRNIKPGLEYWNGYTPMAAHKKHVIRSTPQWVRNQLDQ
mmetsp:Transcript_6181/g.7086  ORF Transcript_6181/g.7086 Transcript_6181/m.7086 type:complete len:80 (+) Transcript_6181:757-996(+)